MLALRGPRIFVFLLLSVAAQCRTQPQKDVATYEGGRSTPLVAVSRIGLSGNVPIGIIFGTKPLLCSPEQDFDFRGKSKLDALLRAVQGTGYAITTADGVYNLVAPDLSPHERKVIEYRFPAFETSRASMAYLGAWLSGYISVLVEGSHGFLVDTLENPSDEVVSVPELTNVTPVEAANTVVKMAGKGLWTMASAAQEKNQHKEETVRLKIYSYHDSPHEVEHLTCPSEPVL